MNKQHEALRTVLKGLSREDLEIYAMCSALILCHITEAMGATCVADVGIFDESLTNDCYRVSLLISTQVEKMLLELN